MRNLAMAIALFVLASCIPDPKNEFRGPEGKTIYGMTCPTDDCAQEARALCQNGHDPVAIASGAENTTEKGGIGDSPTRKLAIQCR